MDEVFEYENIPFKKVSVVILNWNGAELLKQFMPSVIQYTPESVADIVVADNGSTDDSIALLKEQFPTVRTITFDQNYGFAQGYNGAIAHINTKYCVLLNSDVEVTEGWLDAPLKLLDKDGTIVCVQPKIKSQRNKEYFEYAGAAGGYIDKYGYPFCRGRVLHVVEKDKGQYDTDMDILWASGACMFIRTEVYKAEGGLDPEFFAHQEEIDLCWRLRSRGYRLVCTPKSVVYHVGGATLSVESPHKTFLNFRNNLLMVYKNMPGKKRLKKVMRQRFWFDYLAAAKFLVTGHTDNAKAIYQARQEFFKLQPQYAPVRKANNKKRVIREIPEMMQKSLVSQFYFRGRKRFFKLAKYFKKQ